MDNIRTVGATTMVMAILLAFAAALPCRAQTSSPRPPYMNVAKPESVGFSSERLERLHSLIQGEVDKKQLAGAVTILARHGKVVEYRTYGQRDLAAVLP